MEFIEAGISISPFWFEKMKTTIMTTIINTNHMNFFLFIHDDLLKFLHTLRPTCQELILFRLLGGIGFFLSITISIVPTSPPSTLLWLSIILSSPPFQSCSPNSQPSYVLFSTPSLVWFFVHTVFGSVFYFCGFLHATPGVAFLSTPFSIVVFWSTSVWFAHSSEDK